MALHTLTSLLERKHASRVALVAAGCALVGALVSCGGGEAADSGVASATDSTLSVTPATSTGSTTTTESLPSADPTTADGGTTPNSPPASATPNAIFLNHGFVASSKTDAAIADVIHWLQYRKFTHQLLNFAAFSADGTMPPAQYKELAHWIKVSKATDPNQKVIAYLNGSIDMVNDPATWQNIADFCQMLLTQYGVDGINLDFEPFQKDNPNYIGLFSTIRNTVGPAAHLSLDYTNAEVWSAPFFKQVSQYFNWIMPMLYDTTCTDVSCYKNEVDHALRFQYANLAPGVQLVPIVPSYANSTWHLAAVENICTATDVISNLAASGTIKPGGLGVWWYFGWNSKAEQDWQSCWLSQGH